MPEQCHAVQEEQSNQGLSFTFSASDKVKPYGLNQEDVSKINKAEVIIAADGMFDYYY